MDPCQWYANLLSAMFADSNRSPCAILHNVRKKCNLTIQESLVTVKGDMSTPNCIRLAIETCKPCKVRSAIRVCDIPFDLFHRHPSREAQSMRGLSPRPAQGVVHRQNRDLLPFGSVESPCHAKHRRLSKDYLLRIVYLQNQPPAQRRLLHYHSWTSPHSEKSNPTVLHETLQQHI